jgi:phosphoglycolate phosphatase
MSPVAIDFEHIDTILWDWNGTLLNDTSHCIECMNILLKKRGLEELLKERYQEIFTFPVMKYYQSLGFNFSSERFEIPAEEFIIHYHEGLGLVPLFDDAVAALSFFKEKRYRQFILSAMQQEALIHSVNARGIGDFFKAIHGIEDNLAHGKSSLASEMIKSEGIDPERTVLIGDTLHDAEVALENGLRCILVANGHQSISRLTSIDLPVVDSLQTLIEMLGKEQ